MTVGIILCGGKATRLRPITQTMPKALVKVRGKPILEHQIELLKKYNVSTIILACGFKAKEIKKYLMYRVDCNFLFSVETTPLGTGGALKKAMKLMPKDETDCFVLNGDNLSDVSLSRLKLEGSPTVTSVRTRSPYGIIKDGKFIEKPLMNDWINAGIYYFDRSFSANFPWSKEFSLEYDVLAKIQFKEYKHTGAWCTVDSKRDLDEVNKK